MKENKHIELIYTDMYGNKIDINTMDGFSSILNDVFSTCETENQCDCLRGNIEGMLKKARKNRFLEITNV